MPSLFECRSVTLAQRVGHIGAQLADFVTPLMIFRSVRLPEAFAVLHAVTASNPLPLAFTAALAVAIATKITPLALLAYFALRRRAAVCLATVAILALLIVAPAVVMGSAANARELRAFATYAAEKIDEGDNYSLRGVLIRYLTAGHADVSHIEASVADLPWPVVNGIWLVGLFGLGMPHSLRCGVTFTIQWCGCWNSQWS
jgi:hypothetical protein